jgi:hypothetical protein
MSSTSSTITSGPLGGGNAALAHLRKRDFDIFEAKKVSLVGLFSNPENKTFRIGLWEKASFHFGGSNNYPREAG